MGGAGCDDSGASAEGGAEEAHYEAHRSELLELLRYGGAAQLQRCGEGGVGLLNQGATCYMNSLLQALYYTPEFRLSLYRFRHSPAVHGDAGRSIPLQLQRLFAQLQLSRASAVPTKDLTAACGFTGRDTMEQHDVHELCRVLFDALEVSSSALAEDIGRLFAGRLTHYIRSREEHGGKVHISRREERFLDLQVPIQDCKTLEEALHHLVEPEALEGDNRWHCEELGEKIDALKGLTFERLPGVLCLQLMRFVFDVATMNRKKLTNELDIPLEVDLGFLLAGRSGGDPGVDVAARYELAAICIHSGTTHSGHYRAFVREQRTGLWRDANDSVVRVLDQDQADNLFRHRDAPAAAGAHGAAPGAPPRALRSSDAYFLLYRHAGQEVPGQAQRTDVPEDVRQHIEAENARLARLQRAYDFHRKLLEVKIFAPSSAGLSLRKHVAFQLDGLIPPAPAAEPQSVVLSLPDCRRMSHVLEKAVQAFAQEAEKGDASWAWALDLRKRNVPSDARLRLYDSWSGERRAPLDAGARLGEAVGGRSGGGCSATLLLEVRGPQAGFDAWEEGRCRTLVCRWNDALGGLSVTPWDLLDLRLPPSDHNQPGPAKAGEKIATASASKEHDSIMEPDADEMPDLFAPEPASASHQDAFPEKSPLLRSVRSAAAAAWGISDPGTLALVAMSGARAGTALVQDELTLHACGLAANDVIVAEAMPAAAAGGGSCDQGPGSSSALMSVALYQDKKNTLHVAFNHPDRPDYPEEFGPVQVSKDASIGELKGVIAETLGLPKEGLHLCRAKGSAQLKDEARKLREAGLANCDGVFVGHGAPCAPGEFMLQVALYTYEKGSHKARDAFSHAASSSAPVQSLREALVAPLARWGREAAAADGAAPFPLEGLTWRRIRIRDGQAGKQFVILRDERTLRSTLLGMADGRQVAVQVLDVDEELKPDDMVLSVRPWRVREGKLHAPTELIITRNQTLAEFRALLTSRFKGLLQAPGGEGAPPAEGADAGAPAKEDRLEIVALPSVGPPVSVKRCESLKWADPRLNTADAGALAKPLSELREIRDGVTCVIRSQLAAAAAPAPIAVPLAAPKAKGAPPLPKAKASAPGGSQPTVSVARPAHRERGLVIEVAHPEQEPPHPPATESARGNGA